MKILELSAADLQNMQPVVRDMFIVNELKKAGFDVSRHIKKYMGSETYTYLFLQEEKEETK
jgi:hypothetical protein